MKIKLTVYKWKIIYLNSDIVHSGHLLCCVVFQCVKSNMVNKKKYNKIVKKYFICFLHQNTAKTTILFWDLDPHIKLK